MSYILVIVESPAKCKKIEDYLGDGYKCLASFGHLRELTSLKEVDIKNNFHPNYSLYDDERKAKNIKALRVAIHKSQEVLLATDDDREGEAIAWHICKVKRCQFDAGDLACNHSMRLQSLVRCIVPDIVETSSWQCLCLSSSQD